MAERTELPTVDDPRAERCGTCRFWQQPNGELGGLCKAHPPVLNVRSIRDVSREDSFSSDDAADLRVCWNYPRVDDDDWCGEWQANANPVEIYRYSFPTTVSFREVEDTLLLAILGSESLHGEVPVRLEPYHRIDRARRDCVIDAGTAAGRDANLLFCGYITREFGIRAFNVKRIDPSAAPK